MAVLHVRAVVLPDGAEPIDLWFRDGVVSEEPIDHATSISGAFVVVGGLVDCHVHLAMDMGEVDGEPYDDEFVARNHRRQQRAGVLRMRDVGEPPGRPRSPADQRAGALLAPPGRGYPGLSTEVPAGELASSALAQVASGSEWVKVIADFPPLEPTPTYDPAELQETVAAVHEAGARITAHVTGTRAPELVAAGFDCLEHGPTLDHDTLAEMAARGTGWVPTAWTFRKYVGPDAALPVAAAESLGVTILMGSDELPHGNPSLEVEALVELGLSPTAALRAASTAGHAFLGIEPRGLVTYDGDPRLDPAVLRWPRAVLMP